MFTRSNKHSLSKALPWFAPCTLEPWSWLISDSEHMMFSYTREDPKPPGHSRSMANSHARMEPRRSTIPVTNKAGANGSCCVHVVSMFTNPAPITNRSFAPWGWKDTSWWCDNQGSASDGLGFFSWYFGAIIKGWRCTLQWSQSMYSLLLKALVSCALLVFHRLDLGLAAHCLMGKEHLQALCWVRVGPNCSDRSWELLQRMRSLPPRVARFDWFTRPDIVWHRTCGPLPPSCWWDVLLWTWWRTTRY